jgi:hypothetical protein
MHVYHIPSDVHRATMPTGFGKVYVPSRGDVLFLTPSCISFYFPEYATIEDIQRAAVVAAMLRMYPCVDREVIWAMTGGIQHEILDMACAITGTEVRIMWGPSSPQPSPPPPPTNPRRLDYLVDGPIDMGTFTTIVYDAFPSTYTAAAWASCRSPNRDIRECMRIVHEYLTLTTPLELLIWMGDGSIDERLIHPSLRKKLINGELI